jgi:MFS family permease
VNIIKWFTTPHSPNLDKKNFVNVQVDAIAVGMASAAAPFIPVYLTRLNASSFEISLLTTMPAITGLLLSIPLGRLLQKQENIVPWFSASRVLYLLAYALTGIIGFFIPEKNLVTAILVIWAYATIPQTALSIAFSVVMNAVAGPDGRYELLSRRWSILGTTTAITVYIIGQILGWITFPLNYRVIFIGLSIAGFISFYFSSQLKLTPPEKPLDQAESRGGLKNYFSLIWKEKAYTAFITRRFVFLTGSAMSAPLFPLYFVRVVHMPDSIIATISTVQTAVVILGYYFWIRQTRKKGSRWVILWTTLGVSLYPILTGITPYAPAIIFYAAMVGIFQAGLNLVFFDELMKLVPPAYSATFVSFAQGFQYVSSILSPLIGSYIGDHISVGFGLIVSGSIQLAGFLMFALDIPKVRQETKTGS